MELSERRGTAAGGRAMTETVITLQLLLGLFEPVITGDSIDSAPAHTWLAVSLGQDSHYIIYLHDGINSGLVVVLDPSEQHSHQIIAVEVDSSEHYTSVTSTELDNPITKSAMTKKGSSNLERRFDRRSFEVSAPQKSRNQVVVEDRQAS